MNKKAIGFGVWLVFITFVLFALIIAVSFKTYNETQRSLGTWGSDYITDYPLEINRIFVDTMNLGVDKSMRDLAKDSFVDKTNPACASNSEGIIILDENCKPDKGYIKEKIAQDVLSYFKDSFENYAIKYHFEMYQMDMDSPTCSFNGDILTCISGQQNISYEKETPYFTYNISRSFIINQSINLSEKLNLDEIEKLNVQDPTQLPSFDKWNVVETREDQTHYTISLESKNKFFNQETYALDPVSFKFSLRKLTPEH
ncbi:MAG: hypothetical protein NTX24_04510 [Candidatus Pacearchaeota archaeon]|nr:hypothetical protein [Candidatus Pacearchaeota archaeon]